MIIKDYELPEDVQEVMTVIGNRSDFGIALEKKADFRINLKGAVLPIVKLPDAKLARADLSYVIFFSESQAAKEEARKEDMIIPRADLTYADLSGAYLFNANLTSAHLGGATFSRAFLVAANLSGAILGGGEGLTQALLNEAMADPENPPVLHDAQDPETKKPLKWGGEHP